MFNAGQFYSVITILLVWRNAIQHSPITSHLTFNTARKILHIPLCMNATLSGWIPACNNNNSMVYLWLIRYLKTQTQKRAFYLSGFGVSHTYSDIISWVFRVSYPGYKISNKLFPAIADIHVIPLTDAKQSRYIKPKFRESLWKDYIHPPEKSEIHL